MLKVRLSEVVSVAAVVVIILGFCAPQRASACSYASPKGSQVQIETETAVIVWDRVHRVEHFIRTATFNTGAKDFGFLVPEPATPELTETDDGIFRCLYDLSERLFTAAQERAAVGGGSHASAMASVVEVVKSQEVAGLDAVVLNANNPNALSHWLHRHGYATRPALVSWLEPYLGAGWKITAFKIAAARRHATEVSSSVVRMSFPAERPFFPYREPTDQRQGHSAHIPRLLQLYVLSDGPVDGGMGKLSMWPGSKVWSRPVAEHERTSLARHMALRPDQLPRKLWLTVFKDLSSPRAGTDDVFFRPAVHGEPIPARPQDKPQHKTRIVPFILMLVVATAGVGSAFLFVRSRN